MVSAAQAMHLFTLDALPFSGYTLYRCSTILGLHPILTYTDFRVLITYT